MKTLLLEDEEEFRDELGLALTACGCDVTGVASRDAALKLLEQEEWDLMVLDLKVPTQDGALDEDAAHGWLVQRRARQMLPGVPVIAFSGRATLEITTEMIRETSREDVFGDHHDIPMLEFIDKSNFATLELRVRDYADRLAKVEAIEVAREGHAIDLSGHQERVLQTYARQCDGSVIHISEYKGGHSSARVFKARVTRANGTHAGLVVARLADLDATMDEVARYEQYVAGVLPHASHVTRAGHIRAGAGKQGGAFYTLLDGYDEALYDVLMRDEHEAAVIVSALRVQLSAWSDGAPFQETTIGDVRRELTLDDDLATRLQRLPSDLGDRYLAAESTVLHARICVRHGDLHGFNVLVGPNNEPVVIDYGRVGEGVCALDPVILDLGTLFHPDHPLEGLDWPGEAQVKVWFEQDAYLSGSPISDFVRACRLWAHGASAGDREVIAAALCYLIRQLKYDHVNEMVAAWAIEGLLDSLGA